METVEEAVNRLNGMHIKDIVKLFLEENIHGYKSSPYSCPISTYIEKVTSNPENAYYGVRSSEIIQYNEIGQMEDAYGLKSGPKAFIRLFDGMGWGNAPLPPYSEELKNLMRKFDSVYVYTVGS